MTELIVALDAPTAREALHMVDVLGSTVDFYKVGLELFTREGPDVVRSLRARQKRVFLDLKLHDIPNTVAGAVQAAAALDVDLLTLHAVGGPAMLEAAAGAAQGNARLRLLAVTVLTSLDAAELEVVWGRGVPTVQPEVVRLAHLAHQSGIDGVVASALEAAALREVLPEPAPIVTPGIRLAGGDTHDQHRIATPEAAVRAGANHLVLGRAVTQAADPAAVVTRICSELESLS